MAVKNLLSALCTLLAIAAFGSRAQTPPASNAERRSVSQPTARRGNRRFRWPLPPGVDSKAKEVAPPGAVNQGPFNSSTWKYGPAFNPTGGREGLESGQAQDAAGRQGDWRHAVQRHRSRHLLRDGGRRLRLHLDGNAARPARLAGGGADVAYVSQREGGPGRTRGVHRRARDSARARRRSSRDRRADRRLGRRGDRGARLDVLPAARASERRRRAGVRVGDVGRRAWRLSQHHQRQRRARFS